MNLTSSFCKKQMPTDYHELRKKYPKWAHRKDEHRKRRRKSRRRRRRRRRAAQGTSTEGMLLSLLHQLMLKPATLAKKHGENVVTGYGNAVRPDALAPVRSRQLADQMRAGPRAPGAGAGAGAAAVVAAPPRPPPN